MPLLDPQANTWDSAHWEYTLVFENLRDEDVWRRPYPRLLSIGEITSHLVTSLTKYGNGMRPGSIDSPLAQEVSRYYFYSVAEPIELGLTAGEVLAEFERVQKIFKEILLQSDHLRHEPLPFEGPGRTFGEFVDYMLFHVAYHTGQAYSVRHLMGHETTDN